MRRFHLNWVGISHVAIVLCFVPLAIARVQRLQIEIPAGSATVTLRQFIEQTHLQVLYRTDIIQDRRTNAVYGNLEPAEALSKMLAGSGLHYRFVNAQTFVVGLDGEIETDGDDTASHLTEKTANRADLVTGMNGSSDFAQNSLKEQPASRETATSDQVNSPNVTKKEELEEVVVTGTHIRGVPPDFAPLTVYNRVDIERSGAASIDQFARTMTQNFSSVDSISADHSASAGFDQTGANSFQGAGFNLRGLGPEGTLTLLDGHRLTPAGSSGAFVDVSMLPLSAIDRIEVLTDGASAIYGADAIAGVVNIVPRKDFKGADTTLRYAVPTQGGGDQTTASQMFGGSWTEGHAELIFEHQNQGGLSSADRAFIPQQGASDNILPSERSNSLFALGNQRLGDINIDATTYFSSRRYTSDLGVGLAPFPQHRTGIATQKGGTLSANRSLLGDWNLELETTYSKISQSQDSSTPSLDVPGANGVIHNDTSNELGEINLRADGRLFEAPAGVAKLAIGSGARIEKLKANLQALDAGISQSSNESNLRRKVYNLYSELFVPLVGHANESVGLHRLELSLAARYDHYDDFGSSINPKVGILWTPAVGLNFRATYGTSFRPPLLPDLVSLPTYIVLDIPNTASPTGQTTTLLNVSGGNPALRAQKSHSYTAGFDVKPEAIPLTMTAGYFYIDFRDRVSSPPITSIFNLYSNTNSLAPFFNTAPTLSQVPALYGQGLVLDYSGAQAGPAGVQATFDERLANIAASQESGIDFALTYALDTEYGRFGFNFGGTHLIKANYKPTALTASVNELDKIGLPVSLRLSGGLSWSRGGFGSSFTIQYRGSYSDDYTVPFATVSSWTTADFQLSYLYKSSVASFLDNTSISLNVQNITDRDPPHVTIPPDLLAAGVIDIGYDGANASPVGRVVSVQIGKRW